MPSTRRKNQGIDEVVKILRVIARNKDKMKAGELQVMLQATERLMLIDDIMSLDTLVALNTGAEVIDYNRNPTGRCGQDAPPPKTAVEAMLAKIRADMKNGGDNAAIESSQRADGGELRKAVDA
jgi:hypothetical protein